MESILPTPTVPTIQESLSPTQSITATPSPTPSPTTLPSSFYEACVADTLQSALESGTPPDISWCARLIEDDDGPAMPTPRPTTPRPPIMTQRPLFNTVTRTRVPVPALPEYRASTRRASSTFSKIVPRTTSQPLSVLMRSTISQILSRPPDYAAPTRTPAPAIEFPTSRTSDTSVPKFPFVVSFVHEDAWMNRGALMILTLRGGELTLDPYASKDLSQVFVIDESGQIRVVEGQGDRVEIGGYYMWKFTPRRLQGSFMMETQDMKRLMYDANSRSIGGSSVEMGPRAGWFIVPLGRLT